MRTLVLIVASILALSRNTLCAAEWKSLFNGKDLTGWKANVYPDSWSVTNGTIRVNASHESSHLFYVGTGDKNSFLRFTNFELEVTTRCDGIANSGVFFHTDYSVKNAKNHLAKGFEVQLNNQARDDRKTGSLYMIKDLDESPVDETKWFRMKIRAQNKHIVISVDNRMVVDYTEPTPARPPQGLPGRKWNPTGGAIALQGHDRTSVYYFKDIRIRELP
ncbi:MAG: hypothetical protein JWO95_55 [Verrucomicrobiales bacterium]|nr:hypothetical protein [Verrucomicrobiales bacterium]